MTSKLFLQEIPTNDCRLLRLCDSSYYNEDVEITNAILEVTPPGFKCAVFFELKPKFSLVLNSSNLKILPAKTQDQLVCLPDGIYKIKYSINPNSKVYVEYSLLRNHTQLQAFYRAIAKLYDRRSKLCASDFQELRRDLLWIKELMDVAKYKAEECGEEQAAIELYNEANRLLTDFNDCPTC